MSPLEKAQDRLGLPRYYSPTPTETRPVVEPATHICTFYCAKGWVCTQQHSANDEPLESEE